LTAAPASARNASAGTADASDALFADGYASTAEDDADETPDEAAAESVDKGERDGRDGAWRVFV
jgi:hypothetical protein